MADSPTLRAASSGSNRFVTAPKRDLLPDQLVQQSGARDPERSADLPDGQVLCDVKALQIGKRPTQGRFVTKLDPGAGEFLVDRLRVLPEAIRDPLHAPSLFVKFDRVFLQRDRLRASLSAPSGTDPVTVELPFHHVGGNPELPPDRGHRHPLLGVQVVQQPACEARSPLDAARLAQFDTEVFQMMVDILIGSSGPIGDLAQR